MIFPWMFDEIHLLRHFKDAAHLLAEKEDWPPLYDIAVLSKNKVAVCPPRILILFANENIIFIFICILFGWFLL